MAPKRTTRSTADQETINTTSVTNAQLQAMIDQGVTATLAARDALRSTNGDDSHNSGTGVRRTERTTRECTYTDFLKCQPLHFKGTEGVSSLSQWFERMESVFHISNCAVENQVKFATCTLHSVALTWWNTHVKEVGHDAAYSMPWKTLMKMMTDKYCPRNEIRKLEMEMWDLKVKGTDLASYTQRFQALALLCGRMFSEESDKIEKYIREWCEQNYVYSSYIAEFYNTISNIPSIVLALVGLVIALSQRFEKRFSILHVSNMILSIGSMLFHATLQRLQQQGDETPMVWEMLLYIYILYSPDWHYKSTMPTFLFLYGAVFAVFHSQIRFDIGFKLHYIMLCLLCIPRMYKYYILTQDKPAKRLAKLYVLTLFLGLLCWLVFDVLSGSATRMESESGTFLGVLPVCENPKTEVPVMEKHLMRFRSSR
nr:alkaline ceramidase-like [Tanacetum cinerariifolium]